MFLVVLTVKIGFTFVVLTPKKLTGAKFNFTRKE
jgi:hypothetical protein